MSSNSDSSNGSNKFNSESGGGTKRESKLEHTGYKPKKTSEINVIKESLEEKIIEALRNESPAKRQARENLTIQVVPLNLKLSKDNVSYYKITTQVVENSVLKTIVTPIWNTHEQQENEKTQASLNKKFIPCSKHLKLLLGALSSTYRPHLIAEKHSQPTVRKISSQKELQKSAETLKNRDFVAKLPQSGIKTPLTKLIFGTITPSHATKLQKPSNIKHKEQQGKKIVPEPTLHEVPEIKMAPQNNNHNNNSLSYSLSPCRQKLFKKQYKLARTMKPRNDKELKMKEGLLKLLHHLKQTAEETENIIKAFYHHNDIEHLQEYFNTQLNKTTSSSEFQSPHKENLDTLENQNSARLSAETKKLIEAKEHQQKLDISKEKQSIANVLSSHSDRKYRNEPENIQSQTSIRSAKELSSHLEPVDITPRESKRNVLNATRQILPLKEQKPIKIILQKVENRKRTMKLWNDNDYIFDKVAHRNNGPPIPIEEKAKETQEQKTAVKAENAHALNETKGSYSNKMFKEKAEHGSSLKPAEVPNEKPHSESYKINPMEQICIIKQSSSKNYNQITNTHQLISLLPKASLEEAHAIGRQNIKFKENKDQNDKEETENSIPLKNQQGRNVNVKVSKSKMASQKLPAVKRERLRLSRTIRQKGKVCTYCKLRATSQKLPLIPAVNKANLNKSIRATERTETRLNEKKPIESPSNNSADKTKPKETESQLKDHSLSQKNEKPFTSNESNIDMSKSEIQNAELKSKSTNVPETSTKPQSSKESSSKTNKNEDMISNQKKRNALTSKSDITNKKIVLDRAAAKAELKEIELQRKQELKALKEKLTKPKTTFSKSDAYYDYLQRKLKVPPHERQQTVMTKPSSVSPKKNKISIVHKKAKSHSVAPKRATGRQKLDKHKSKVLSQEEIDQYFKCPICSDKSFSGSDLTPMPKYGCPHSHLTYEDLKSVIKTKTDGSLCKKLPQKTKVLEATPQKKDGNSCKTLPQKTKVLEATPLKKDGNSCETLPEKTKVLEATPLKKDGNSCKTLPEKTKVLEATPLKKDGNSCKTLPQKTKVLEATPLKKSYDSKLTPKEDKFTPILKTLAEKDAENGNQSLNKKPSCKENKMPDPQCVGEKINTEPERKSKAKSNTKTTDACKSIQPEHQLSEPCVLHCMPQKGSSDACEKQHSHTPTSDLKRIGERVKELYLFTATDNGKQNLKNEQYCNSKKSVKKETKLKNSFSAGVKHMQQFKTSIQNKLKKMEGIAEKNKAEELKAKQAIKKALLTNIHEAVKVKNLKDGFRNNFHWYILKTGIQNSIHGRNLLSAVKQSLKSLSVGFKGSVNSKELQLAFREGIKSKELLSTVRQSINLPLLFRSLANATREYTKLKYQTLKKIQEESSKKDGGDNSGASSAPKQPSGDNCNKQRGDAKHEARAQNKSQMLYRLNNTIYEQFTAQPLLMKDIKKLMTEILTTFPNLPLKTAECLQLPHVHKYISKHFTGLNTSVSYIESRPMLKSVPTAKELPKFVLKLSDFVDGKAEQKSTCLNKKQTKVPSSKEVKFFQGFWRNHGPKVAVKAQINSDIYSKQNPLQQLNAMTKAIYEADGNAFTTSLNRRLSINQLLRDFFSPNEHSSTDRKTELNEAVSEKSPEEALRKLIHDNMHTVNKTCISENAMHNANKTLKEKILLFFLKHDMIYVTEDMPKYLIPSLSENTSNKQNCVSASIQEIQNSSHKHSDLKSPRGIAESIHTSSSEGKGATEAKVTETGEKSKGDLGKAQARPEHTPTKPEKLSVQPSNHESNLTGLAKYFNSETINGRANVAKATLTCVALGYLYYLVTKQPKPKKDTKLLK